MNLREFFESCPKVALAFSGGCDSAYLLHAAKECGADVRAYYVKSAFQPDFELQDAEKLASQLHADMRILEVDVLADANVRRNPENRCYFCKQRIFRAILDAAREDGYSVVIDGTNASDDAADRPGMRALSEMEVRSPLRECGISKKQVRKWSREAGLFTWNKPAYACLATRIPAGSRIEEIALERIERGEAALAKLGFSDFRLRLDGKGARLEVTDAQLGMAFEKRSEIIAALDEDFERICVDLKARKGMEI